MKAGMTKTCSPTLRPGENGIIKAWLRFCLLFIALNCLGEAAAEVEPPQHLVIQATENLVNELRTSGEAIKTSPRLAFELANKDIIPLIDFPTVARRVLGRHWHHASVEQRRRFTREFRTFIINLYVTAMITYSQEIVATADSFKYPPSRWTPGETTTRVRMKFRLMGAAPIEVGYDMRLNEGIWKIYDVHVLGLDVVAIYRNNFASEIKHHGLSGLIERLAAKNNKGAFSIFANSTESGTDH